MAENLAERLPDFARTSEVKRVLAAIKLYLPLESVVWDENEWRPIWEAVRARVDEDFLKKGGRALVRPTLQEYGLGYEMVAVLYFADLDLETRPFGEGSDIFSRAESARDAEDRVFGDASLDEEAREEEMAEIQASHRDELANRLREFLLPPEEAEGKLVLSVDGEGRLDASFFGDVEDFAARVERWLSEWLGLRQNEPELLRRRVEEVTDFFESPAGREGLRASPHQITSVTYELPVSFGGKNPQDVDIVSLFNAAHATLHVPYIHAIAESGEHYIKIFRGAPHVLSTPPTRKINAPGSVYFHVWVEPEREAKDAFLLIRLSQAEGSIVAKISGGGASFRERVLSTLENNILECYRRTAEEGGPVFALQESEIAALAGEFTIATSEPVEEFTFLHYVLLDDVANQFLYAEESAKATSERKQLILRYSGLFGELTSGHGSASPLASGDQPAAERRHQKHPYLLSTKIGTDNGGTKGTKIAFSKAASEEDVRSFFEVLRRLLSRYEELRGALQPIYQFLRPALASKAKKKPAKQVRALSKQKILAQYSQEIFGTHYATECQCKLQPVITTEEAYEKWKAEPSEDGKFGVLAFRYDNGPPEKYLYLTCESNENAYIGLKCSKLPSASRYPFLPCCMGGTSKRYMLDRYQEYLRNPDRAQDIVREACMGGKTQRKGPIKTQKVLLFGRTGKAIPSLADSMKGIVGDGAASVLLLGVHVGQSAFLACVLYACRENAEQMSSKARAALAALREQRGTSGEKALEALRAEIAAMTRPALLRQELYDDADEAISRQLYDPVAAKKGRTQGVLDPALHFRALEEYFKVNIVTIARRAEVSKKETGEADVQLPKNQLFHARVWRYPRTVVLFRHRGNPTKVLAGVPAVELVQTETDKQVTVRYQGKANEALGQAFERLNEITVLRPAPSLSQRNWGVFQVFDWAALAAEVFGSPPSFQLVDSYGKMRALGTKMEGSGSEVWCFFEPAPPVNLPEKAPAAPTFKVESLWPWLGRGKKTLLHSLQPTAFTGLSAGDSVRLSGLWFSLELENGEAADCWIPVADTKKGWSAADATWTVAEGPFAGPLPRASDETVPFAMGGKFLNEKARRLDELRRRSRVLRQLARWVYLLWAMKTPAGAEGEFGERYFRLASEQPPIAWELPAAPLSLDAVTPEAAMELIAREIPGLAVEGRFSLSENLRELVAYDLRVFARWVQGAGYLTTDGRLAFRLGWSYQSPTSEGLVREMRVPRGVKPASLVRRDEEALLEFSASGQLKAVLVDELHEKPAEEDFSEEELVFYSLRERNRALIKLTLDQENTPLSEWLLDFPWMSSQGSLRVLLTMSDFQIKDPFYYEHVEEDGEELRVYMIQNVEAGRGVAELRAANVAWTWLTRGVNLGKDAPPETIADAGLEEYRVGRDGLTRAKAAADKKWLLKVVNYGPGMYGAMLDPAQGGLSPK